MVGGEPALLKRQSRALEKPSEWLSEPPCLPFLSARDSPLFLGWKLLSYVFKLNPLSIGKPWFAYAFLKEPRLNLGLVYVFSQSMSKDECSKTFNDWLIIPWSLNVCSVAQSCPTLCDPMGNSRPGSSVHRILQARILE